MKNLESTLSQIEVQDESWGQRVQAHLNSLAMPPGALGLVQETACRLATLQKTLKPRIESKALIMACADHGVAEEGVSAYPQITNAIVNTALNGGATINACCRQAQADLYILDMGVKGPVKVPESLGPRISFLSKNIASGTANMRYKSAMTQTQCEQALLTGIQLAEQVPANVIALGEMGIGNTTSAACLMAQFCNLSADQVTGPGTGVHGDALENKKGVVADVLSRCADISKPFEVLQNMGGFEIATLVGVILGSAVHKKAVVLDGFISGAAALAAVALAPACRDYLFAGHQSAEPAHARLLAELGLKPLLQLDMRLGEGTGAALALNSLDLACELLNSMMTLDEALKLQ